MSGASRAAEGRGARRGLSLRMSLVLGFGTLLLLTAGAIVWNNLHASRRVLASLSTSLLRQTTSLAEMKLQTFFGDLAGLNTGAARRMEAGFLTWGDWDALRRYMQPVLQRHPHLSGVGGGDSEGNAWNLVVRGDRWHTQTIRPAEWGRRGFWQEWDADGHLVREWWEESEFDPRVRPWYLGAVAVARQSMTNASASRAPVPHWTAPYRFYTTGEDGVTVATRVPWTNTLDAVIYFDLTLKDLDAFVQGSRPSAHGFTLMLNDDLEVIAWPGEGDVSREKVLTGERRVELAADRLPLLAQALDYWRSQGRPAELVARVPSAGYETFWLGLHTILLAGEAFHVLVAVPETDLIGEVIRERQRVALVLVGAVVGGVLLALWLAGLYARPIGALVRRSAAIQRLDLSPQAELRSNLAEVRQLADAQSSMRAALESFSRYVPRDVIAELLRQGEAARIGAHPAELTVLFSDIRRFTALSENLPPDDIARQLSEYFDALHTLIAKRQGTTDKFIGDALMAFWGAPRPDDEHALHAVEAALDCSAALEQLNRNWHQSGRPEFQTTFGLATGPVVVGNVGARDRLNYTVLGSTVNLASRCVGLGRNLGCAVLAAESVMHATAGRIEWRRVGPVQVKGLIRPVLVCEPLGRVGELPADLLAFRDAYESALDRYLERDFAAALPAAEGLKELRPRDLSVAFLERRSRELAGVTGGELHTTLLLFGREATVPEPTGEPLDT